MTAGALLWSAAEVPAEHQESVDIDIDIAELPSAPDEIPASAPGSAEAPSGPRPRDRRAHAIKRTAVAPGARARGDAPALSVGSLLPERTSPARFALSAGTVATQLSLAEASAGAGTSGVGGAHRAATMAEGDVSVPARLLASSPLVYPREARQAEVEVDFPLEIVVDASGRVISARGLTRAGYGLDEAALSAIREYRFSPALRDGYPVRVRMHWTVQFRLQ